MPSKKHKVIATKIFFRDLKKIPPYLKESVLEKKNQLAINPYQGKKLTNMPFGRWRVRIGDYRIRYDIEDDEVVLKMIRHRKDVYKK